MIPLADNMVKVRLRTITKPIQSQQIITRDNVSIGVAAVAYYRRVDPVKSIVEIEDVACRDLRDRADHREERGGPVQPRQVSSETEALNEAIKAILDTTSERWGVSRPARGAQGHRAPGDDEAGNGREAEAEREKRAKIIAAEGEALSAGKLAEAADVILDHPIALQLRNLQVLGEIAVERNSTIIFPAQFLDSVRTLTQFVEGERSHAPALGAPTRTTSTSDPEVSASADPSPRGECRAST